MKNKQLVELAEFTKDLSDNLVKKDIEHVCQFFKITDEVERNGEMVPTPVRWGIKVMCAMCGQRRILWTDGEVVVL